MFGGAAQVAVADPHLLAPMAEWYPRPVPVIIGSLAHADAEGDEGYAVAFGELFAVAPPKHLGGAVGVDWRGVHRRRQFVVGEAVAGDEKVGVCKDDAASAVKLCRSH